MDGHLFPGKCIEGEQDGPSPASLGLGHTGAFLVSSLEPTPRSLSWLLITWLHAHLGCEQTLIPEVPSQARATVLVPLLPDRSEEAPPGSPELTPARSLSQDSHPCFVVSSAPLLLSWSWAQGARVPW